MSLYRQGLSWVWVTRAGIDTLTRSGTGTGHTLVTRDKPIPVLLYP